MKKIVAGIILCCIVVSLIGCGEKVPSVVETIDGFETYCKMSDGTWRCKDYSYRYRLEISGRMPNAVRDSTFVYLSNLEEITFEQAWRAAGLSSDTNDYFSPDDAVLVELG